MSSKYAILYIIIEPNVIQNAIVSISYKNTLCLKSPQHLICFVDVCSDLLHNIGATFKVLILLVLHRGGLGNIN